MRKFLRMFHKTRKLTLG